MLVLALRPKVLVLHYSAFDPQSQGSDNPHLAEFIGMIESAGLSPFYMIYSRTPVRAAKIKEAIEKGVRAGALDGFELGDRFAYVPIRNIADDRNRVVGAIADALTTAGFPAKCADPAIR